MTDTPPQGITRWYCPNCGQTYFGDDPPDMCDFCGDFTTWKPLLLIEKEESWQGDDDANGDTYQLPLF